MKYENFNDKITIRPLKESDFEYLNEVCNRRLGDGYLDYEDFLFRVKNPELNLVADENGKAVSLISMTPEGVETLAPSLKMTKAEILDSAGGKPLIHFRTAVTDEEHDGLGLMRYLLKLVIKNARDLGYGLILSPTWVYDGKAPAANTHKALGFTVVGEKKMLWYNQKGYTCVYCKGPCRCDALLFQLKL